jgi:peptidoglycan/LPS O-acetylase OafA/YrhL
MVFFLLRHGLQPRWAAPDGVGALHILTSATFLHGWHPETINGVVPGAWTIAVEMTFYALFPLLVIVCTSFWRSVAVFVATLALSFAVDDSLAAFLASEFPKLPEDLLKAFRFFFFFNHLPVFILGIAVFHALNDYRARVSVSAATIGAHACLIPILALPFLPDVLPKHISYGLAFAVLAFFLGCGAQSRFVNARICHIGKVSYSGYLVHLALLSLVILNPVIDYLSSHVGLAFFDPVLPRWLTVSIFTLSLWFVVTWISIRISTMTYAFVERPMIKRGAQIAARWHAQPPALKDDARPLKVI